MSNTSNVLDCLDCGKPWPAATRDQHSRCYCPECTAIRLHDPRKSLSFPRDEQTDLDLPASQPSTLSFQPA